MTNPRRRGRPSKGPRERFTVRFKTETAAQLRATATRRGKCVSDIVAEAVQAAIGY